MFGCVRYDNAMTLDATVELPVSTFSPAKRGTAALLALALSARMVLGSEIDPEADHILRAMSDYLAGLKTFSFVSDASTEVILQDGRKIQFTATGTGLFDRDKGFRIERQGPVGTTEVVYDGKQLVLANSGLDVHLILAVTGGPDAALDAMRSQLGAEVVGGSDLVYANPYDGLLLEVESGEYLGQAIVGGMLTDHLSYRAADIDWQLWVRAEGDPLPVKYVITSKWMTGAPQFSVQFSEITPSAPTTAADFTFTPPPGSKLIDREDLAVLGAMDTE